MRTTEDELAFHLCSEGWKDHSMSKDHEIQNKYKRIKESSDFASRLCGKTTKRKIPLYHLSKSFYHKCSAKKRKDNINFKLHKRKLFHLQLLPNVKMTWTMNFKFPSKGDWGRVARRGVRWGEVGWGVVWWGQGLILRTRYFINPLWGGPWK